MCLQFLQVYAHTGYKVKRSSWILKKTLSNSSTYSNKLNSISEARNSVEIIVDEETNGVVSCLSLDSDAPNS